MTAVGTPGQSRVAALTGDGTLTTVVVPDTAAGAGLFGEGTLTVVQALAIGDVAALAGDGTLMTVSVTALAGQTTLAGNGQLLAAARRRIDITLVSVVGRQRAVAVAELPGRSITIIEHKRVLAVSDRQRVVTVREASSWT
jgi:hypothetical protein